MNEVLFCIIFPVCSHCLQFPRLPPSRYWMFPLRNIKLLSVSPRHHPPPRGWACMGWQRVCLCVFGGLLAAEAMLGLPCAASAKHSAAFPSFPSAPVVLPRTNAPNDWLNSCPGYIDVCVSVCIWVWMCFVFTVKHCQWRVSAYTGEWNDASLCVWESNVCMFSFEGEMNDACMWAEVKWWGKEWWRFGIFPWCALVFVLFPTVCHLKVSNVVSTFKSWTACF